MRLTIGVQRRSERAGSSGLNVSGQAIYAFGEPFSISCEVAFCFADPEIAAEVRVAVAVVRAGPDDVSVSATSVAKRSVSTGTSPRRNLAAVEIA